MRIESGAVLSATGTGTLSGGITGGGLLDVSGSYVLGTTPDQGHLDPTIAAIQIDAFGSILGGGALTGTILDDGRLSASGTLTLDNAVSGNGLLMADTGAVLDVRGGGDFAGALSGQDTIDIAAPMTLATGASLVAAQIVDSANLTLAPGETLVASPSTTLIMATTATRNLSLLGSQSSSFTNEGTLIATGPGTVTLARPLLNEGTIASTAASLTILGSPANDGTITADTGIISIHGRLLGTGALQIGASATLSLLDGAASTQTLAFLSTTGAATLADPLQFLDTISNFAGNDIIDLIATTETSFTFSGGALTVFDGTMATARLDFSGSYTTADFSVGSDGHGGTVIGFV